MGNKGQGLTPARDPLWYKDAIIYQLHVRSFSDSDADGIGDFPGLTSKLDYLQDLGVTAIWLMPFYPSPLKDDGYDIADYYEINPMYGTLNDFKTFLEEAHRRGLRVLTELVINHTSDQHSWFQKSRRAAPNDPMRNYYVWTNDPTRYKEVRIIFKDFEPSNWTWDPVAKAYYWHRFFAHQPDLNFDHPKVHEEILNVIDYWCDMGVDGFRLDAIPYLYEREGTSGESLPETHAFLKKMRAHVDRKYGDRVFIAEANQWPEEAVTYFGQGQGDECHMAFHFPVMPRLFMAVRMEERVPIVDILEQTPAIPETSQWAIFLRNHDELTLEMVTDEERDYMYRVYAHEAKARINLGIRRRLAPLLGNNRRVIELLNTLLLSLPGTPVIYYGDEIGMGDNIYLGDRNGVRTPMHWSPDRNAGFSRATPQALQSPIIVDPEYHYEAVNVETHQRNTNSLLWWNKRMLALRKKWKAFGRGSVEFLHPANRKVLAFLRRFENEIILVVANLSRFPQPASLDLAAFQGCRPRELFGRTKFPAVGQELYPLTLGPHAAFWFTFEQKPDSVEARPELPVIDVDKNWHDVLTGSLRPQLEAVLPDYLRHQRWFAGAQREIDSVVLDEVAPLDSQPGHTFLLLATVNYVGAEPERYFIPVAFAQADAAAAIRTDPLRRAIAELRGGVSGLLYDASTAENFARALIDGINRDKRFRSAGGEFVATRESEAGPSLAESAAPDARITLSMRSDFNNTTCALGDKLFVKLFRRIEPGTNPELEVTRFLRHHGFNHVPSLVGGIDFRRNGDASQLGTVTELIPEAVTGWKATVDALGRFFDRVRVLPPEKALPPPSGTLLALSASEMPADVAVILGIHGEQARLLGQRTGEMHAALASDADKKDFAPEPFTPFYQRSLYQSMRNQAVEVFNAIRQNVAAFPENVRPLAAQVAALQSMILGRLRAVADTPMDAQRIRVHGDYHLTQVLYTGKDFVIIDFEGDWSRPMSERRIKRTPLRDAATMIRSFDYAAHIALAKEQQRGHFTAEQSAGMDPWVRFWSRWIGAAFLRGYLAAVGPAGVLPKTVPHLEVLLDALLLNRALAELGDEFINRPGSVHIPLKAVLELMEQR